MTVLEFTLLVSLGSLLAGLLGSLTGLGGGVVLVPLLTIFFKVDLRYAIRAFFSLGHSDLVWRGGGLRERRILQHSHRHVSRNRHHSRRSPVHIWPRIRQRSRYHLWIGAALFCIHLASARSRLNPRTPGSFSDRTAHERQLPNKYRHRHYNV